MSLNEVNELFYLLENPTRRRILELLSRESHYPLQLTKERSVTQQAVVKHLNILEEHGLVNSDIEPSNRGPSRRVYHSTRNISLRIDVSPSTFKEQAHSSSEEDKRYLYRRNRIWHFKKRLKGTKKIHRCSLHTDDLVVALQKRDALLQKWNEIDRKN